MSGGGSVRRYGKGSKQRWRWDIKRTNPNAEPGSDGRRPVERLSRGGYRTKAEAQEGLLVALGKLPSSAKPTDTLGSWLRVWLPTANDLTERSRARYESAVRLHLIPRLGGIPLRKLRSHDIAIAYAAMVADGLSPKSVSVVHSCLSRSLSDAVAQDLLSSNLARGVKLPRDHRPVKVNALTTETARRFLKYLSDSPDVEARWSALFTLMLTTGIRVGEALSLRWQDIDLESGRVTIASTYVGKGDRGYPRRQTPKTRRSRLVHLPPQAVGVLKAWHQVQVEQRVGGHLWDRYADEARHARTPEQEFWPTFTVPTGEVVSIDFTADTLEKVCAATGVKRLTPHGLRHTYATVALEAGTHPKVVSDALGHASTGQTMETYSHVMPSFAASVSEHLGEMLFFEPEQST